VPPSPRRPDDVESATMQTLKEELAMKEELPPKYEEEK
jgi:hypothetical protein